MMKKAFFTIALSFFAMTFSCGQTSDETIIGIIENNSYRITADTGEIKRVLETQLRKEGNQAVLTKFEIRKDVFDNDPKSYYYILVAQNESGSTKIAFDLLLNDRNEFTAKASPSLGYGSTCTCFGSCTQGCDPRHWVDAEGLIAWRCSKCARSNKTCNKSVTDQ